MKVKLKRVEYKKVKEGLIAIEIYTNGKMLCVPIKKGGIIDYIFSDETNPDSPVKFINWAF